MRLSGRLFLTAALSVFTATLANGQGVRFDLSFDGLFDNREFKGDVMPQTRRGKEGRSSEAPHS